MFIIQVDSGEQKVPVDNAISAVQKCYLFCANFFCLIRFADDQSTRRAVKFIFILQSWSTVKLCDQREKNTIVGWFNGSFSVFYVISPVICRDKSDARWELFFFRFALFPFVNRLPFHLSDPIIVFLSFYIGGSAKLKDIWYSKMVEKPKIR